MPFYNPQEFRIDAEEAMRRRGYEEYYADQMQELPSDRVEVKIRLNQSIRNENRLTIQLYKLNMDLSRSEGDVIIVSGIPRDNKPFGEQEILKIVKKYAPQAEIVREGTSRGQRR